MEEQVTTSNWISEKGVKDYIEANQIVWVKSSNNQIHCGRVDEVYEEYGTAWVFNFEAWTHWIVDFKNIVRIGTSYYSEEYRNKIS